VALKVDTKDKSKPIELHQVNIKLISTERKQLNPEDDIGNMRISNASRPMKVTQPVNSKRGKSFNEIDDCIEPVNVKRVRLIKPVPKTNVGAEDTDSGILSLPASLVSASSID